MLSENVKNNLINRFLEYFLLDLLDDELLLQFFKVLLILVKTMHSIQFEADQFEYVVNELQNEIEKTR